MPEKIYIKNMVCDRCKLAVKNELDKAGIKYQSIELGEVVLNNQPPEKSIQQFQNAIEKIGFEIIEDKNSRLISKVKSLTLEFIKKRPDSNFSEFLTENLHKDYSSISALFSAVEGITIEKYLILQRIERVKELLVYDEQSLSQVADDLGYSSVNHLSAQFKKITGLTPSHFKKIKTVKRQSLDQVG